MAELLSVQIYAPLSKADEAMLLERRLAAASASASSTFMRLKKIDNVAQDGGAGGTVASAASSQFDYLPKRKAVNVEFKSLTYSVSEGRKKGL